MQIHRSPFRPASLLLRVPLGLVLCAALAAAQSIKLNGPFAAAALGGVGSFQFAAGGSRVVFHGDLSAAGGYELYSVPSDGSAAPIELGTSHLTGNVLRFAVTGDGAHVVLLNRAADLTTHLYRLPVMGGTPILLSGANEVDGFTLDPSGARVVYRAVTATNRFELFGAPSDGSMAPVQLSGALVAGGRVEADFALSPDGARVVYRADAQTDGVTDLYSAPVDGSSAPVRLNLSRPLADVKSFQIGFDSLGVVYAADQDTPGVVELYAVEIDGSSVPLERSSGTSVIDFDLAAASDRIIYRAAGGDLFSVSAIHGGTPVQLNPAAVTVDRALIRAHGTRVVFHGTSNGTDEVLYAAPADGSAPAVALSAPGQIVGDREGDLRIAEVSGRALYIVRPDAQSSALYSVPLNASAAPVRLHDDFPSGVDVLGIPGVLADGTVLFTIDPAAQGMYELLRAPVDGSAPPVRLSRPLDSGNYVFTVAASPDGTRVAYVIRSALQLGVALQHVRTELFSTATLGGPSVSLSGPVPTGGPIADLAVTDLALSPRGDRATYLAAEEPAAGIDLHSVLVDGSGKPVLLDLPLGPGRHIRSPAISGDGERVVYMVENYGTELHSAPIDRRRAAVRIDREGGELDVNSFALTPDSQSIVFAAGTASESSLFLAPIDGSAPPVVLLEHAPRQLTIQLTPDGQWVLYPGQYPTYNLFSFPLDGHQGPVELSPSSNGASVAFTPDSRCILYLVSGPVHQLYRAPVDGSAAPATISGPSLSGVQAYRLAPDGQRVVFEAYQNGLVGRNLYSALVDGSQPPVMLNATNNYNTYFSYQIDPSSSRVIYAANEESLSTSELFSAPIDGSAPRVKLSGVLGSGEGVTGVSNKIERPFRIGAGRVVYAVGRSVPERLLSVPIEGGTAPVHIDETGFQFSVVELSAKGDEVLFMEDHQLFARPIDASAAPRKVGSPSYNMNALLVHPDGERVLYLADPLVSGHVELFTALLGRPTRRANAPTRMVLR